MPVWALVIPLTPGQSVKEKHNFRLGQENLTLIAKIVKEYDTHSRKNKNEIHNPAEAMKCIQFSFIGRVCDLFQYLEILRSQLKMTVNYIVVTAIMSMAQSSSFMEKKPLIPNPKWYNLDNFYSTIVSWNKLLFLLCWKIWMQKVLEWYFMKLYINTITHKEGSGINTKSLHLKKHIQDFKNRVDIITTLYIHGK